MVVAIDGPAGAGKGTIAKLVSKELNLVYVDTGAMYRCLTLKVLRDNIKLDDHDKIIKLAQDIKIKFLGDKVLLDSLDVTDEIRSLEVTNNVSLISCIKEVRDIMVDMQRKYACVSSIIMEGRDITTVVFPKADFKFYLDASLEERAKRRVLQNKEKGISSSYEEIYNSIKERDYDNEHRRYGALKIADDAIYIDTTSLSIPEVVSKMVSIIKGGE